MSSDAPAVQESGQQAESSPSMGASSNESSFQVNESSPSVANMSAGASDDAGPELLPSDVNTTPDIPQEDTPILQSDQDLPIVWKNPETGEIDIVKESKTHLGHDLLLDRQNDSEGEKGDHIGFDEQGKLIFIRGRTVQSTDAYEVDSEDSETRRNDAELW